MNLTELKQDFYKRFNASDNFVYYTSNGIPCALLGCTETEYTPALMCTLSMGIQMFTRRLNGDFINLQEKSSNKALHYIFGSQTEHFRGDNRKFVQLIKRLEPYGLKGAQVLFEYSAPKMLQRKEIFLTTLTQALLKTSDIELDALKTAALASQEMNLSKYLSIVYSKKGYCTLLNGGRPQRLPLPFTGYKIVSVHCGHRPKSRSKQIRYAFEHVRRLFPHISSVAEVTPEMLALASPHIRSRQAIRYLSHLVGESSRIKIASDALKRCDTKTLFMQMRLSQASMERYWDLENEDIFIAECCHGLEGVTAARAWDDGVAVIVEERAVDRVTAIICREFEVNVGYQPSFCVSDVR